MGLIIGMDEAGYGPNLGPLVVTATVWEVPGHPRDTDFWTALEEIVTPTAPTDASRLHVADSKLVYSSGRGLANLERSVLCALRLCDAAPQSFQELCSLLTPTVSPSQNGPSADLSEPWFQGCDLSLPHAIDPDSQADLVQAWQDCCECQGIRLRTVRSDIVLTERFNRLTRETDSKGVALSSLSMRLLRQVWDPDDPQPIWIIADKHGGRMRYDSFLQEILDERMLFRQQETRQQSVYRVGTTEIRFQMKAESHFPVAVASMVSKYVRELAMELFNRYWCDHIPDLKPTKGYPVDAARFREDVANVQQQLGITDDVFWRER